MVHMETNTLTEWVHAITGGAPTRSIARRISASHTTIARYLAAGRMPAEMVMELARAYGVNPIDALMQLGFISADEATARATEPRTALMAATNE